MKTIVAVLGYLYQGDYGIPLHALEDLKSLNVDVIDLSLGAMKAASLLNILSPDRLIILAADKKGKKELRVYKPKFEEDEISSWMDIVSNLRAYYMDLNSFLKASHAMSALPKETIVIECEAESEEGISLSEWGEECKRLMIERVKGILDGSLPLLEDEEEVE